MSSTSARRDTPLNIRATEEQRQLIDNAARALGKSRSEFMIESAVQAAEDIMLDRTYFILGDDGFAEILAMLDAPPEPTQELRDLMAGRHAKGDR